MSEAGRRWTGVPAARSTASSLQVRLFLVLSLLGLSSGAGLLSFFMVVSSQGDGEVVQLEADAFLARGDASIVAESFVLGTSMSGISLAQGVSPRSDGILITAGPAWVRGGSKSIGDMPFEEHVFLVHRRIGTEDVPYELHVLMLLDSEGGNPTLAANPMLVQVERTAAEGHSDYRDRVRSGITLPGPAQSRLARWADAWAQDDAESLRVITGDPAGGVRYIGLGGYTVSGLQIPSAVDLGQDRWLVRVRLILEDDLLVSIAGEHRVIMDMDVTVESASTGNPRVVGWGPAGSGETGPQSVRIPERRER